MRKGTVIIAAMEEELNALLDALAHYEIEEILGIKVYSFTLKNKNYYAYLGQVGKVNTAFMIGRISSEIEIERIFNIGTAGSLKYPQVKPLDVIIATKIAYFDVDVTGFNYEIGQMAGCPRFFTCDEEYSLKKLKRRPITFKVHSGLILSGDSFVTKKNYKKIPLNYFENPLACEMESGAVGQVAILMNIPFVVLRSISDCVIKDDNALEFDITMEKASSNCAKVLLALLKSV